MVKTLNYDETLELIEQFMIEGGIRSFCTDYCKGECCKELLPKCTTGCATRKLPCSIYICSKLIKLIFMRNLSTKYYNIRAKLMPKIRLFYPNGLTSIYTDEINLKMVKSFKIHKEMFEECLFDNVEVATIAQRMDYLKSISNNILKQHIKVL